MCVCIYMGKSYQELYSSTSHEQVVPGALDPIFGSNGSILVNKRKVKKKKTRWSCLKQGRRILRFSFCAERERRPRRRRGEKGRDNQGRRSSQTNIDIFVELYNASFMLKVLSAVYLCKWHPLLAHTSHEYFFLI